ncbi:MAG: glycosyltransferase [Mariprofundales bacterium]|nr:glycosyltransferase [Mariprofundales bacterium]
MHIAMLSPIAWRTPPRHYGPWERVVSLLTEGLVAKGIEVTLFATGDSMTKGHLHSVCKQGYEENENSDPKVMESLHISELFDRASDFDIIHNHFDFLPLTYSGLVDTPLVTTIHGFSSPRILPVYEKYNGRAFYIAISEADKADNLDYIRTIHHGIDLDAFTFNPDPQGDYLLFFGRIHPDKGAKEAIEIALRTGSRLMMAGIIQDEVYYEREVKPHLDHNGITFVGSVGPEKRDALLKGASALLHPINFNEPFGLSVIEAMACGTPVIAFNRGSMPELIRNGLNGYLVSTVEEAVDAVEKLGEINRADCRKFIEANFSVDRMVNDYIKVYEEIIEKTKREDRRPWGYYEVFADDPNHKVKRIIVYPGKRLSLQRHKRRSEHWHIIYGEGVATLDDREIILKAGDSIDIPIGSAHRMANRGTENMAFVEVQRGDYFGEDDIERLEDDFGRS